MLSKEDWIASHRKQFPDARPDVLGFIYDFSSRSSDLYEVFVNGYCFYFANMLREAFNGGDVCWSVGSGLSLVPWQVGTFISKSSLR